MEIQFISDVSHRLRRVNYPLIRQMIGLVFSDLFNMSHLVKYLILIMMLTNYTEHINTSELSRESLSFCVNLSAQSVGASSL